MMVEARCLAGRLIITTMDITSQPSSRHVARQMRHALLTYMQGEDFNPQLTLPLNTVTHFFTRQAAKVDMFTKDSPDELKPKIK